MVFVTPNGILNMSQEFPTASLDITQFFAKLTLKKHIAAVELKENTFTSGNESQPLMFGGLANRRLRRRTFSPTQRKLILPKKNNLAKHF